MQGEQDTLATPQGASAAETEVAPNHLAEAPAEIPERIGKYQVRGEIGRGACGVVYRGFDPFVQRDVAIKVALHPATTSHNVDHERQFFAEARAAGMLAHPHIVSLYDAGVEGDLSYLVMEYIDGETLQPLCRQGGPRPPLDQVIDIAYKCARALDYAHSKGVLHRDIKPSNIMLAREGMPKLMDFSIAEITGTRGPEAQNRVVGSPLYMAPEQVRREPLGPETDLYALGAVIFQLLTGQPPFPFQDIPTLFRAIRSLPAPSVRELRPDVPHGLSEVVARLLVKKPSERFQSGAELAGSLSRVYEQLKQAGLIFSRRESRDSLRRLHFFNGFTDEEIDEILNASTMRTFQPGERIIDEGEVEDAFYILAVGSAEVRKAGKPMYRLERGDCVGEIGFLGASKRTASVIALSQVLTLRITGELMDQVSRDCQLRFYKVFTQTLLYRLSVTTARLSAMPA